MDSKAEKQDVWNQAWGKVDYFSHPFTGLLSTMGPQLGQVIVDIGAGKTPVTSLLDRKKHKVIEIDLASDEKPNLPNTLRIRFDIENVIDDKKNSTRAAIAKIAIFLDIDRENCYGSSKELEKIDTFIFSQILNYIDFKEVLRALKKYLKPGGQIILNECFSLGIEGMKSDKGLSTFEDLTKFLRDEGYEPSNPTTYDGRLLWKLRKPKQ